MHTRKLFFLFANQNTCCGYSKERSQAHMFKQIGKKIVKFYAKFCLLNWPYDCLATKIANMVPLQ